MKITIEYEGNAYTLEYDRETARRMEREGFRVMEIQSAPVTMVPMLFAGAFYKRHKKIRRELVDEIYENLKDRTKLIDALINMYADTISTLTDDEDDDSAKNATWTMA